MRRSRLFSKRVVDLQLDRDAAVALQLDAQLLKNAVHDAAKLNFRSCVSLRVSWGTAFFTRLGRAPDLTASRSDNEQVKLSNAS